MCYFCMASISKVLVCVQSSGRFIHRLHPTTRYILIRRRWTWRHRQFWIQVQFNGKPNFNLKLHYHGHKECKIIWEFQIRWGGISHLKPLRKYLRYFRGTHWRSSLSRRLLAFYTWMNRVTHCLYAAQWRSRDIGEWLKRLFCGHGRSCPPSSDFDA